MLRSAVDSRVVSPPKMLETLLQNRIGLKYMQSKKLVASGREKLGMDKNEPWTPELEAECIKIYEAENGPIQARDYSTPDVSATPPTPAKVTIPKSPNSVVEKPKPPVPAVKKEEPKPAEPVAVEEEVVEPELTPEEDAAAAAAVEEKKEEPVAEQEPAAEPAAETKSLATSSDDDSESDDE